jgi:hypothetical protein
MKQHQAPAPGPAFAKVIFIGWQWLPVAAHYVNAVVIEASQIQISAFLVDEVTQDISQPADFQEIVGVPDELHLMASRGN